MMPSGSGAAETGHARLQVIDVSRAAAPFRYVTFVNYVLFLVGIFILRDASISVLTTRPTGPEVAGRLFEMMLGAYWAWTAVRDVSVLSTIKSWNIYFALLLMGVLSLLGVLTFSLAQLAPNRPQGSSSVIALVIFATCLLTGCSSLLALMALVRLRLVKIPVGKVRMKHLLCDPQFQRGQRGPRLRPQNAKLGIGYIAGAIAVLIGGGVLTRFSVMMGNPMPLGTGISLTAGYGLLIMARQCFQPSFETVMSSDERAPILFLHSFFDDERMDNKKGERALLDFSLEARLAKHFNEFGPFIAVGAPSEARGDWAAKTHLGAVRVQLTDDEWQEKVMEWMGRSAFIVCMVGWSHWVTWELRTVVERKLERKLLLVFPDTKLRGQSQTYDVEDRLTRIHEALQGTAWEETLTAMGIRRDIRCLTLNPDGRVTAVVCRSRTRSAYELSALVGHARLLGIYGNTALEVEAAGLEATSPA